MQKLRLLHLWIGIITGLIFSIVCISGAFTAFVDEAINIVNKKYIYTEVQEGTPKISVDSVISIYEQTYPEEKLFVINAYNHPNRSYNLFSAVTFINEEGEREFDGFKVVYASPYTGEVLRVDRGTLETIVMLLNLHTSLFMGEKGHVIIKICSLIFLIELIVGIWLWFPKVRRNTRKSLKVHLRDTKQNRNADFHRVIGFYSAILLLVMVLTGIILSFDFIKKPVIDVFGGDSELLHQTPPMPELDSNATDISYQSLYDKFIAEDPRLLQISFSPPFADTVTVIHGSTSQYAGFLNFETAEPYVANRYTGEILGGEAFEKAARNNKITGMLLTIHMGIWGGLFTKILYFLVGIIGFSLPITGFIIWRRRRKEQKKLAAGLVI